MVYICYGTQRKRLVLDCSRFYGREELFDILREKHKNAPLCMEFGPNLYQPIMCDVELRLVCSIVEKYISSHQSDEDFTEHKLQQIDTTHTIQCEARMRRKPRPRGLDQRKPSSSFHYEATGKTREFAVTDPTHDKDDNSTDTDHAPSST